MKLVEFYEERQGRPASSIARDMETRAPSTPAGVVVWATLTQDEFTNNYTAKDISVILVDASASAVTITLPAASSSSGRYYYIKKVDASSNLVTIKPDSSVEKIDGEIELKIGLQYGFAQVLCSGVEAGDSYWHIIGGVFVKLETLLEDLLQEQIAVLAEQLEVLKETRLHLASLSDANVEEHDS